MRASCFEITSTVGDVGAGGSVGRYELLSPIARGGMAVVWAARLRGDRGFQKLVALKSMLPGLSDDPRIEEMFLAEARFASQIKHPHVCSVLDLGEHDGALFLVMEWVDGETVSALGKAVRDQGGFPIALATRIAIDAASGLHAAHELESDSGERIELVHRDVSPQNILVTRDGIVKIVDFGVAKAISQGWAVQTESGFIKGKFAFMSPEQAAAGDVDRRTDVFALGLVLYQMITGTHPFRSETPEATLEKLRTAPILPPDVIRPECPASLSRAIMRALERDPAARFQTMVELGRALERALVELAEGEADEDLAAFVARVAGSRIERRRAAIKDAIRIADERGKADGRTSVEPVAVERDEPTLVSEPTLNSGDLILDERTAASPSAPPVALSSWRRAPRSTLATVVGAATLVAAVVTLLIWRADAVRAGGGAGGPDAALAPPTAMRIDTRSSSAQAAAPVVETPVPAAVDPKPHPAAPDPPAAPTPEPSASARAIRSGGAAVSAAPAAPRPLPRGGSELPTVRDPGF